MEQALFFVTSSAPWWLPISDDREALFVVYYYWGYDGTPLGSWVDIIAERYRGDF